MSVDAIDCQGLGGGMTLGFVQAGAHIVGKMEQTGSDVFMHVVDANRALIGDDWEGTFGSDHWLPRKVPLVFGNPPCSGFSMMSVRAGGRGGTRGDYRGPQASINSCMWDLVSYAAQCRAEVVVMESVPSAGSDTGKAAGRGLMRALRDHMETLTGHQYYLTHVFHNGLRLGGSSERRRYFMVLSRAPFSVSVPAVERMPTLGEVIGDLPHDEDPAANVYYAQDASWWATSRRNATGRVAGNATWFDLFESDHGGRLYDVIRTGEWRQGEHLGEVVQRFYERTNGWPGTHWGDKAQQTILRRPLEKGADYDAVQSGAMTAEDYCAKWGVADFPPSRPEPWQGGAYMPKRWRAYHHAHVMAGNALNDIVHPTQNRTFTYREAARVMGFPDNWDVTPYYTKPDGSSNRNGCIVFGKGVLVDSGRWIGEAALTHLGGGTLEDSGESVGEREFLVDHKNLGRDVYKRTFLTR